MFTPFDPAKCKTNISRIKRSGAALQKLVHETAVSTLAHIRDHGDYTLATALLDALPTGQRVKALAHWYKHFSKGAVTFSYDSKAGWLCKIVKNRTPEMFDIDGAYATTFADLTAEKNPGSTFGVKEVLAYLKRKANDEKLLDNGEPRVSEQARELMAALYVRAEELIG